MLSVSSEEAAFLVLKLDEIAQMTISALAISAAAKLWSIASLFLVSILRRMHKYPCQSLPCVPVWSIVYSTLSPRDESQPRNKQVAIQSAQKDRRVSGPNK
ncbi:unnamed protein product [Protopolystoma xenopodis]|uniref:Uncharacterized protein n=1 Tax=Protopolystoma xenopodis TaxID=117903 RepID=A0A448XIF0_9PLAT|nr:unnamed protein product [Protopolystoma xenopodis]